MSLHYNSRFIQDPWDLYGVLLKIVYECMCFSECFFFSFNWWIQVLWFTACKNENSKCSWFSVSMPQWIPHAKVWVIFVFHYDRIHVRKVENMCAFRKSFHINMSIFKRKMWKPIHSTDNSKWWMFFFFVFVQMEIHTHSFIWNGYKCTYLMGTMSNTAKSCFWIHQRAFLSFALSLSWNKFRFHLH